MAFDNNRKQFTIETFEMVILETDIIGPTCTVNGQEGWYTPLTCDEDTVVGQKKHIFTTPNFPIGIFDYLGVDTVFPQIPFGGISETPAKIRPNKGLAGRGTMNFKIKDFDGDPGPTRTSEAGKYLAKLRKRNILENKPITLILGHTIDGVISMNDLQVRHFVVDSFEYQGDDEWSVSCKDELYLLDKEEAVWPPQTNGYLRSDIDNSTTSIPVDADTDYSNAEVVRVGDELMKVISISGNLTPSATLNVSTRGSSIQTPLGVRVSVTRADEHEADDEVFICELVSDSRIDDLLVEILTSVGLPLDRIPVSEWASEIDLWHPTTRINTLYIESKEANDVIGRILRDYLMDIWFDPVARSVRLSAISVWRETDITLNDGVEIESYSLNFSTMPEEQYTRTSILYDKRNLAESDDAVNYKKLSRNVNSSAESDYGVKLNRLEPSILLDKDSADLLVQRQTARTSTPPVSYSWVTREQFLDFNTGDVANINSPELIGLDGLPQIQRAQIISIKPVYNQKQGRLYNVKALSYEPPVTDPDAPLEIVITGRNYNLNLHILAGAPPTPVEVTYIFDAATVGSGSVSFDQPAIRAGNFANGSKLTLIWINGSKWSSKGGGGGLGGESISEPPSQFVSPPSGGSKGGLVYWSEGVDTDIWLEGTIGSYTADGQMRAPGGGATGGLAAQTGNTAGGGGGGGAGIDPGQGGISRILNLLSSPTANGNPGDEDGNGGLGGDDSNGGLPGKKGGDWGEDGEGNFYNGSPIPGGAKGHSLKKDGAVVNIYGSARFTQGGGDTPDDLQP